MRPEIETTVWQAPPFESSPSYRYGWIEEFIREGEGYIESQQCYKDLGRNLRVFNALYRDRTKSTLSTNKLKYNIRKLCETVADVREIAEYGSDFPGFKKTAEMLTKASRAIYLESNFPYQLLKVLQYATVFGIGYMWAKVRAEDYGYAERKMVFDALGLLDVIPVQVPKSNDVQDAYGVTIFDYMPIAEACGRFPLFQGQFQTVGRRNYRTQVQAKRLDYAETFRYGDQGRSFGQLYTEIRYTFIRDLRINTTGYVLPMGDQGTSWFYEVPFVGKEILGGYRNGQPFMRPAAVEDCRVYPTLRLVITAMGIDRPLYDGPAFDWDPKIPVVQYTVDDWAWEPLGRSLVSDVAAIETTKRKIERHIDQVVTVSLNPPLGYNIDETGGPKIEHFDMFGEDVRIGLGGTPKQVLQSVLPEGVEVSSEHLNFLKYLADAEEEQLGIKDVTSIENIKMNIASDTAEKMIESVGPIAKGMAMRVERGNQAVGNRMKYLIPQWYTVARLMEYVGPDGISRETFDYDPNSLVPSHLPDEMPGGKFPSEASRYDQLTRARWFVRQLRLTSIPSTLLKITQVQEQLKYLQLKSRQAPISWLTVLRKLDVPNPEQEIERSFKEQVELEKMTLLSKIQLMQELKKLGIDPNALMGGEDQGQEGQGGRPRGRPQTDQRAPRLKQKGKKGGEPRTVMTTS